jgi:hypothetical protein
MLLEIEEAKSTEPFEFIELVGDLQKNQMPWLESRKREAAVKRTRRERRMKKLRMQLRGPTVPLPFDIMHEPFKDINESHRFEHDNDALLVFGPRRVTSLILRLCAAEYHKRGGRSILLSMGDDKPAEGQAVFTPNVWHNCGDVFSSLAELLEAPMKEQLRPFGLLVVDDLDHVLTETPLDEGRYARITRALAALREFQGDFGMTVIVALERDEREPKDVGLEMIYPPFLTSHPYLQVKTEPSKLVAGSENVIISCGTVEDTRPLFQLEEMCAE